MLDIYFSNPCLTTIHAVYVLAMLLQLFIVFNLLSIHKYQTSNLIKSPMVLFIESPKQQLQFCRWWWGNAKVLSPMLDGSTTSILKGKQPFS